MSRGKTAVLNQSEAGQSPVEAGGARCVLRVEDLIVDYPTRFGALHAVNKVSFTVGEGETLALVGESGCGKSTVAMSLLGLAEQNGGVTRGGRVAVAGEDILARAPDKRADMRGNVISLVFQEPMTAFNPLLTVGEQLKETLRAHSEGGHGADHEEHAATLLARVGVPDPARRLGQYPGEFSGGMLQRAMIAVAIANQPRLIVADEPVTALDVTVQAQIIDLFCELVSATGAGLVMVTHDLGIVAEIADRVVVMYAGRVVESAPVECLFADPRHPYTVALLSSRPRLGVSRSKERLFAIRGSADSALGIEEGCPFQPRCPIWQGRDRCLKELPELLQIGDRRAVACHFSASLSGGTEIHGH